MSTNLFDFARAQQIERPARAQLLPFDHEVTNDPPNIVALERHTALKNGIQMQDPCQPQVTSIELSMARKVLFSRK
jgi:hypothetical protein